MKKKSKIPFPNEKQCRLCSYCSLEKSRPYVGKFGSLVNKKGEYHCELIDEPITKEAECPLELGNQKHPDAKTVRKYYVACSNCGEKLATFYAEKTTKPEKDLELISFKFTENLMAYKRRADGSVELHCQCEGCDSVNNIKKWKNNLTLHGSRRKMGIEKIKSKSMERKINAV